MADIAVSGLLQKIIKNLHVLHEFTIEELFSYEALLRETMIDIHQLLGFHNTIPHEIVLRVDPKVSIGSLSVLSNSSKNSVVGEIGSDIFSVIQAIQRGGQSTKNDIIRSMVKLLADSKLNSEDRRPKRVRNTFSGIFIKLANLIDFFTRIREEAEEEVIVYINRCFNYEAMFYSYLSNRISANLHFNDEDAERLVTTLDKIIERDAFKDEDTIENTGSSIFSYESGDKDYYDNDSVSKVPLRFQSSDNSFDQLYQIFFRSLCLKESYINGQHDHTDFTKYIRIMLKTFKSSRHIDYFELNDAEKREEKYKKFYEFLIGRRDGTTSGLLPELFNQTNFKVLDTMNFFPELDTQPSSKANLISSRECSANSATIDYEIASLVKKSNYDTLMSRSNRSNLIRSLHYLINLLNEFELNLDIKFPGLFNYYLRLVFNEMIDSVDSSDHLYIERVNNVSARLMELDDENVKADEPQVKETVYFFCRLVNQLSEIKDGKKISCTILMILANYEYKKIASDAKSVLNKWNDLMLGVAQLNHNLLSTWYPLHDRRAIFSVLKKWYSKYRRWEKVRQVTAKMVDQTSSFDIFIERWLEKVKYVRYLENQAHMFNMGTVFSLWNRKSLKLSELLDTAVRFERSALLKRFLWKSKRESLKKSAKASETFLSHSQLSKSLLVRKHVFLIWHERLNHLVNGLYALQPMSAVKNGDAWPSNEGIESFRDKLSKLLSAEKYFLLSKFFEKYRKAHQMELRVFSFRQRQQLIFIAYIFSNQWLRKLALRKELRYSSSVKDIAIKRNFFSYWKHTESLNSTARNFTNRKLVSGYFARWKIAYLYCFNHLRTASLSLLPVKTIFVNWIMLRRSNSFNGKASVHIKKLIFESWASKYNDTQLLLSRAMSFDANSLKRQKIKKMLFVHKKFLHMENVAQLNIQRKYFNILCSKQYLFSKKYASIAIQKCAYLTFSDKISLSVVFSLWLSRFETLQEERNESLLEIYQDFLRENIKRRILECWVVSYDRIKYVTMELNRKCEQFSKRSLIGRKFFHKWMKRKNETLQLRVACYNFERQILLKKFTFIWYTQFTELVYLYDLYDDFVGQREYTILREFLSIWNMRYIKDVKRNQQSCGLFVRRGEVALLRSVFELWLYKIKNFNNINYPSDTFIDSERSINSNPSPLANKSSRKSYNVVTDEGNSHFKSYLNTPLKTNSFYTPFTPRVSQSDRISPTKLQETTSRAKSSRIDALRRHFSRARANSTPKASKQLLENRKKPKAGLLDKNSEDFVHLSPPQKAFSGDMYPPNRPNFSESIFATEVENGLSTLDSPEMTQTTVDEKSLIATAKQMRRITPIYIPIEEEGLEPRVSPVRKLKEKLKGDVSSTIS